MLGIFSKERYPLGALKASIAFLWNPGRAAQGTHLGLCAGRELLSNQKQGSGLIPVQCAPLRHRKGEGTLYPARWWARVRMSNVTKPLSVLATITAKELKHNSMLAASVFLIPSGDAHASEKAEHSGLCTVDHIWVCHTLLGHHLQEKPRKNYSLACRSSASLSQVFTPLFVLYRHTAFSAAIRCSYFSSHSSGSENLTLAPAMHLLSWQYDIAIITVGMVIW